MLAHLPFVVALAAAPLALAQDKTYASTTTWTFSGSQSTPPPGLVATDNEFIPTPAGANSNHSGQMYMASNVFVHNGFLTMLVNGGQDGTDVIKSGQVTTDFFVSQASVETHAILTENAGVVNGMFMFQSTFQETDIEWLSAANSGSNTDAGGGRHMFYTNQPTSADVDKTFKTGNPPKKATSTVHNYRLDWDQSATNYYLDGKHQFTLTSNVPSTTNGQWFWNCWSNGDAGFSAGPPTKDAVFQIQKIVMRYNPGQ